MRPHYRAMADSCQAWCVRARKVVLATEAISSLFAILQEKSMRLMPSNEVSLLPAALAFPSYRYLTIILRDGF